MILEPMTIRLSLIIGYYYLLKILLWWFIRCATGKHWSEQGQIWTCCLERGSRKRWLQTMVWERGCRGCRGCKRTSKSFELSEIRAKSRKFGQNRGNSGTCFDTFCSIYLCDETDFQNTSEFGFFLRKNTWSLLLWGHTEMTSIKGFRDFCERKLICCRGKHWSKQIFRSREYSGKNPSHPQTFACLYIYDSKILK